MSIDFAVVKSTCRDRLLRHLSDLQWHSWEELKGGIAGTRVSARIKELRRMGYQIESKPLSDGSHGKTYRLISLEKGEPDKKTVKVFLNPEDVEAFLSHRHVTIDFLNSVQNSYASFKVNEDKL